MKLILLVGGPRGGLDLFQSLLDNHDEILQFPGIIHINEKLIKILSHKSKEKIAQNFTKEYLSFFDSRKSIIERHYMLGDKKKQFYKVNTKDFIERFKGKIINIHPSLLPKYKGIKTHERAIKNKDKYAGCTVHYVNAKLDSGEIIIQKKVKVTAKDNPTSLAKKILKEEHKLYPAAILKILN